MQPRGRPFVLGKLGSLAWFGVAEPGVVVGDRWRGFRTHPLVVRELKLVMRGLAFGQPLVGTWSRR